MSSRLTLTTLPFIVWLFSFLVRRILARSRGRSPHPQGREAMFWGFGLIAAIVWGVGVEVYKFL